VYNSTSSGFYSYSAVKTDIYNEWTYNPVNRPVNYFNFSQKQNSVILFANYGNQLSQELSVLKTNVGASDLGVLPSGLGDLIYSGCTQGSGADSIFVGKSVRTIIAMSDSALTLGRLVNSAGDTTYRWPLSRLTLLNAVCARIDSEFYSSTVDTFSTKPLRIKGVKPLYKSILLRRDPNTINGVKRFVVPNYAAYENKPTEFKLEQNYPNPFNPTTTIEFSLMAEARVTLKVYNVVGQEVMTLLDNQDLQYGHQGVQFNASNLASGVYFYRMEATTVDAKGVRTIFTNTKKMLLLK